MIRFRPLPVMTVFTLIALVTLAMLGRWQWDKYVTKSAAAHEPVAQMTIANYQVLPDGIQFVNGVRPDTHEEGWRVFVPVQYGATTVFVDSDFIAQIQPPKAGEVRPIASLRANAPITGASIRPEHAGPFAHAPLPLQRLWFYVDLAAMGRNAGLHNVTGYYIASSYVGADGRAGANPFALAKGADVMPPARHLGYAFTWYGLAAVLLVMYFAYHANAGRLSLRAPRGNQD
ncbi:MAG: SURF1 family cytochrome oxidase biogenesis protein [Terricaulis sp.]